MLTHSQIAIFVQQTHAQTPFWYATPMEINYFIQKYGRLQK